MRQWIPNIRDFRLAIWLKLNEGYSVEEVYDSSNIQNNITRFIFINIPFKSLVFLMTLDLEQVLPTEKLQGLMDFFMMSKEVFIPPILLDMV